jgi:catechol 1,2-dioxygenase
MEISVEPLCRHPPLIHEDVSSISLKQEPLTHEGDDMDRKIIDALLAKIEETESNKGTPRIKAVVNRIVRDLFYAIEELDVQPDDFWAALNWLAETGRTGELGLVVAGLGFERFLDLRMDEAEANVGLAGGTPRTIEGPLYVSGAPRSEGEARLDDGTEQGETLFMQGQVLTPQGEPVPGAIVEVWHANTLGNYSYFDKTQSAFNLRGTIATDAQGRYSFRSIIPSGYGVPPEGTTQRLLDHLGRHGRRPAHIHFFVSAPGFRKLTTQINIDGDPYLWDDFAFATRDNLVPAITRIADPDLIRDRGVDEQFASIDFDFTIYAEHDGLPAAEVNRPRAANGSERELHA